MNMDGRAPQRAAVESRSAAEVLLRQLAASGIDYFFANGGTDFPPIVEAYARAEESGEKVPRPIVVPHENAAVAMAHGIYLVTGRPQALMVHVNVGTANAANAILDASRENVPMLLMAGRSPYSETGHHGTRTRYIHWAQEMFDQAGQIREAVKWDYELHLPDQASDCVTRGLQVAMSVPRGPVYLSLPRDVLAAPSVRDAVTDVRRHLPDPARPAPEAIARAAEWLATAVRPLIITANAGRTREGFEALTALAERFAIPVVSFHQRFANLPSSHPMNFGSQPRPLLNDADAILVVDCDVPWIPSIENPPPDCRIIHVADDPGFTRYPMRSFPSDLSIAADTPLVLGALAGALDEATRDRKDAITARRARLTAESDKLHRQWREAANPRGNDITPEYISRCVHEAVGDDAAIVNEYPLRVDHCPREKAQSYFGLSPAGGLGWGLGAALGIKLAEPSRMVVATLGDGAYIFANPTACHWVAEVQNLPILTVIFNNQLHGAVRNATMAMYGQGAAARSNGRILADLSPSPAFEKLVEASGGYGVRVDTADDLPRILAEAVRVVREEGRQALVNVVCDY